MAGLEGVGDVVGLFAEVVGLVVDAAGLREVVVVRLVVVEVVVAVVSAVVAAAAAALAGEAAVVDSAVVGDGAVVVSAEEVDESYQHDTREKNLLEGFFFCFVSGCAPVYIHSIKPPPLLLIFITLDMASCGTGNLAFTDFSFILLTSGPFPPASCLGGQAGFVQMGKKKKNIESKTNFRLDEHALDW